MAVNCLSEQLITPINRLRRKERNQLCEILNRNDKWEDLADLMKYDVSKINNLRRCSNPMEELLEIWSYQNYTIEKLFILLSDMHHYQAMSILEPFVHQKYHRLLCNEKNFQKPLCPAVENSDGMDLKIEPQNFNQNQTVPIGNTKVVNYQINKVLGPPKILNSPLQQSAEQRSYNSNNMLVPSALPQHQIQFLVNDEFTQIPYEELVAATGSWSKYNILGKNSFGTVFKGTWKRVEWAITRIEKYRPESLESYLNQTQQSLRELDILYSRRHDNILPLCGYYMGPEASCLVYQYMSNGSLRDRLLFKERVKPLNWFQRLNIAKGTARGLQFLHTFSENPLIHGNIKSSNIFLDGYLEPKIRNFRWTHEEPETDNMAVSRVHGTRAHSSQECLPRKTLSTKIDTYGFGIVLLELATGLIAYDPGRQGPKFLKNFIENYDKNRLSLLKDEKAGNELENVYYKLVEIGMWCAHRSPESRPEMETVVRELEQL